MIDAKPVNPPNRPAPDRRPKRPAPSKPPMSMEPNPPNLDGVPTGDCVPGCEKVRFIGAACPGAVEVLGGALKVRLPRLPKLLPPPMRASAWLT